MAEFSVAHSLSPLECLSDIRWGCEILNLDRMTFDVSEKDGRRCVKMALSFQDDAESSGFAVSLNERWRRLDVLELSVFKGFEG